MFFPLVNTILHFVQFLQMKQWYCIAKPVINLNDGFSYTEVKFLMNFTNPILIR